MRLWNRVVKGSPWRVPSIVLVLLLVIVEIVAIHGEFNKTPTTNPTTQSAVATPSEEEVTLAKRVRETRATIENGDEGDFAVGCFASFGTAFNKAEELTGIKEEVLVGIAAYESAGCSNPGNGKGNMMHISSPDLRHILAAEHLLQKNRGTLRWKNNTTDNVVLGAVMIREYEARTRSLNLGLSAYRHGPNRATFGDDYTVTVLAHIDIAKGLILAQQGLARR